MCFLPLLFCWHLFLFLILNYYDVCMLFKGESPQCFRVLSNTVALKFAKTIHESKFKYLFMIWWWMMAFLNFTNFFFISPWESIDWSDLIQLSQDFKFSMLIFYNQLMKLTSHLGRKTYYLRYHLIFQIWTLQFSKCKDSISW